VAELAEWEPGVLAELADTGVLESMFFPDELNALLEQAGSEMINFAPVGIDEQGRLDEKAKVTCPGCGHEFTP
jgi:predicted methyltransferase MtxX (methanogen marker protein 4)